MTPANRRALEPFVSMKQAADLLGISINQAYIYARAGRLDTAKVGALTLVLKSDVIALTHEREQTQRADSNPDSL